MRVLFISHGFPPVEHSGTFRSKAFARYLPEFGIEPIVLSAADAGRVLPYATDLNRTSGIACSVHRTPWKLDVPKRPLSPALRLLQRMPLGFTVVRRAVRRAVVERVAPLARELICKKSPELIYASSPPIEALSLADTLGSEFKLPVVCDLRDPWTYCSWAKYRHIFDFLLERRLERQLLNRSAAVIANTPTARSLLVDLVGVAPSRVVVIPNGFDESEFSAINPNGELIPGKFVGAYTGLLSTYDPEKHPVKEALKCALGIDYRPVASDANTRSARWFLAAVDRLLEEHPNLRGRLRVLLVGNFSKNDLAVLERLRHRECVQISPPVCSSEAIEICCRANLLLLLQIEMRIGGRDYCTAIPGKLYAYLRSGTRILAPMQPGDGQSLIERFHAGVVVPPRDVDAIANALLEETRQWERQDYVRSRATMADLMEYERRNLTAKLAEIFRKIATPYAAVSEPVCPESSVPAPQA